MKKRILSLLLVVAMVAAMIVVPVPVEVEAADAVPDDKVAGNNVYEQTKDGSEFAAKFADGGEVTAPCPVCTMNGDSADKTWTPYAATLNSKTGNFDETLADGDHHYYLEENAEMKRWQLTATTKDANVNSTVCFFLNGKTYTTSDRSFIINRSVGLNVMGDGTVTGKYSSSSAYGSAIDNLGEVNLYGGIWKRAEGAKYIIVGRGSDDTFGNNNVLNIYEGTVIDGEGRSESTALVRVTNYADINMYGGEIKNGVSTGSAGGNVEIYCYGANRQQSFNLYVGTVSGGTDANGVSIYIDNTDTKTTTWTAELNIYDGAVTGGSIYVPYDSKVTVTLSGSPQIDSLDLTSGVEANMTGLSADASVGVTAATDTPFTTAFETADDATACAAYISCGTGLKVAVGSDNKKLYLTIDDSQDLTVNQACPHCNGKNADFEPWNFDANVTYGATYTADEANTAGDATLEGTDKAYVTSGHYYLLGVDSGSETYYVGASKTVSNIDVVLDLNGYEFSNSAGRALYVYGSNTLSIMDSSTAKTGVVSGASKASGGTINTARDDLDTDDTDDFHDYVYGNLNLYGVKVDSVGATSTANANGGALYLSGDTYIENSTINGHDMGTTKTTYGGAIYTRYGTLTMKSTVVNGGKVQYGGAIYVASGTTEMTDCEINGASVSNRGGQIYMGAATVTLNNCKSTGGETSSSINNYGMTGHGVYANSGSANLTINGGSFDTVYSSSSSITLKGAPTITNLYVWAGANTTDAPGMPLKVSEMTGGNVTVTVLVNSSTSTTGHTSDTGAGVFTNTGLTNTDTLRSVFTSGMEGYVLQVTEDKALELAVQVTDWYCEACEKTVTWTELTDIDDDNRRLLNETEDASTIVHYYLSGDMSEGGVVTLGYSSDKDYKEGKWHIDLCGNTYASTNDRAFSLYQGSELAIQSSVEGGKVTGIGKADNNGGVILTQAAKNIDDVEGNEICTVKLYDVTLQLTGSEAIGSGGVLSMAGSSVLYAKGATIDGSVKTNNKYTNSSGNAANSNGGAIYGAGGSSITLVNTTVKGGTAYNGGAIYLGAATATLTLDGCTIEGGHATNNGGSVYRSGGYENAEEEIKASLTIKNTIIENGHADNSGGNIYAPGSVVNITNGSQITGGVADGKYGGGNIYLTRSEVSEGVFVYSELNVDGESTVSGGTGNRGGNICAVEKTNVNISGASTISGGVADSDEPNSDTGKGGSLYLGTGVHTISGSTVTGGKGILGGNIYLTGSLTLSNSTVSGGTASVQGGDIYVNGSIFTVTDEVPNQLVLGEAVTANMGVGFSDDLFADGVPFIGKIQRTNAAYAALVLTLDGNRGGAPVTVDSDGYLTVAGYSSIAKKGGSFEYYASSNEALAAFDSTTDAYVKICEDGKVLTLAKDVVVDLNGSNVTLSGAYTVSGFDSASDLDNHSGGFITLADGATAVNAYAEAADGLLYITYVSADGTTVKFHRAEMDITGVSLRPGADVGIYYWAQWDLDEDLIAKSLNTTGVVYNIEDVKYLQGINFENRDTAYLYTAIGKDGYSDKTESTGGFMGGFLVAGDEGRTNSAGEAVNKTNKDALGTVVYATTYLALNNGCTYLGDDIVGYSLETLVLAVDSKIVDNADTDKAWVAVNTFATTWLTAGNNLEDAIAFANYVAASSEETV